MTNLTVHTERISRTTVTYRRGGPSGQDNETIVLLHGAGGSGTILGLGDALAATHDVIIPDHPGFGASDTPDWLSSVHDLAYFYLDFLDTLDLTNVHLVGQSLGGWVALETAVRSTQNFSRLTLCGAAGINLPDVPMGDLFSWDKETRYRTMIVNAEKAEALLAMPSTPEQDAVAAKNEETTRLLSWEPRFHDPALPNWLHRIDVPTHIIWGADDPVFPLPYGEALKDHIPDARLSVIQNCGHLPQIDAPDELIELIQQTN